MRSSKRGKYDRKTREGRSTAERSQVVHRDPLASAQQRERERAEEKYWASLAGPVTVRHKDDEQQA